MKTEKETPVNIKQMPIGELMLLVGIVTSLPLGLDIFGGRTIAEAEQEPHEKADRL